jgi:hypothetical protein
VPSLVQKENKQQNKEFFPAKSRSSCENDVAKD